MTVRSTRGRRALAYLGIALVLPLVVSVLLLWSFLGRSSQLSAVPVAIVNDDQSVTVGTGDAARTIAGGRQLAADLTDTAAPGRYALHWVLTDAQDAADGLASGRYGAVLTIPPTFSAALTSTSGPTPEQAHISVASNASADGLTGAIAEQAAVAAADALGDQASASYLDNLLVGYNTISQQMVAAAGSAASLSSGATQLASSSITASQGATTLSASMSTLQSGAASVDDGAASLASGAANLAAGAAQTAAGASGVAGASTDLQRGAAGAATAAQGVADSASRVADQADEIAASCPAAAGAAYCARVTALAARSRAVATAADGLSQAQQAIAHGASSLSAAADDLSSGAAAASTGADALASNSTALASGASQLATGVQSAASGASQLADGVSQLAAGSQSVSSGASELAAGLQDGAASVPTYTDEQRTTLQTVVTQPVVTDSQRTDTDTIAAWPAAMVASVMLWLGAIAATGLRRRLAASALVLPADGSLRAVAGVVAPTLGAAATQGVVVWLVLLLFGLPASAALPAAGLLVAAAVAFAIIATALRTIWPRYGAIAAILLLAVQLVFSGGLLPLQAAPHLLQALSPALPLSGGVTALAHVVAGIDVSGSLLQGLTVLACWSAIAIAAAAVVTRRRSIRLEPSAAGRVGAPLPGLR